MAKASKPYPNEVCRRLDRLYEQRLFEKNRETDLRQERKALKGDLAVLGAGETAEHKEAGWKFSVVLFRLEHCRDRQKDLANRIDETIKKAHQPGLYEEDDDDLDVPEGDQDVFKSIAKKLGKGEDSEEEEDPDQMQIPVGGPSAKEPPKKPAIEPAPVHQGVDMHLAASVNELDMPKLLKVRLLHRGINTVADAIKLFEDDTKHPGTVLNCGEKIVANIKRAVATYRDTHRKAMVAKFTTGSGED